MSSFTYLGYEIYQLVFGIIKEKKREAIKLEDKAKQCLNNKCLLEMGGKIRISIEYMGKMSNNNNTADIELHKQSNVHIGFRSALFMHGGVVQWIHIAPKTITKSGI